MARFARFGRCRWTVIGSLGLLTFLLLAAAGVEAPAVRLDAQENEPGNESGNESGADEADAESGVALPTDRLKERQLDRASRLIADKRWTDAAILLDEILSSDRDFFFRPDRDQATWRSIKVEASRLVGSLPQPGSEAYALQFRGRADRLLQQAIASGDAAGVVAVARRWFHTPAGHRATMLAAIESLDSNQPLAAAAWLDRLNETGGAAFEPTLSFMRAIAWWRAGDRNAAVAILEKSRPGAAGTARIGGADVAISFPPGSATDFLERFGGDTGASAGRPAPRRRDSEWWLHRGDAARNAISTATRPLLVPRYRVPLTRHPEEARLLEKRRRLSADRDAPLLPAGTPLAVDGAIILHTPMGLLAVDFESGKRVWLKSAGAASAWSDGGQPDGGADVAEDGLPAVGGGAQAAFTDATSGTISSNGILVFAVEGEPASMTQAAADNALRRVGAGVQRAGNFLSAYDVSARGELRWRLPRIRDEAASSSQAWYMGAPLTIGDQLFVLVEEKGEIRLDVLDAAEGRLLWSQPLASLDEDQLADRPDAHARRLSGLSPSFAEGVLVCPTGAGAVVAVDLATRTLLWAYNYPLPAPAAAQVLRNGVRIQIGGGIAGRGIMVNGGLVGGPLAFASGWRDAAPILAGGRVMLTPVESDKLHCLDLRSGAVQWRVPRGDALYVAGVVDGRVILVGRHAVDALSLENGRSTWEKPLSLNAASPSGRGIVTQGRLFLPVDTPEVVEVDLATGRVSGRSPARGGAVPGNLLACRGEVISQGVDSLDVFHQAAPLEERIETALRSQPPDPWALLWRGELDLDGGRITDGMQRIRAAQAAEPGGIPSGVVAEALLFAMRADFAAAAPLWREMAQTAEGLPQSKPMLCVAIDGFLGAGDLVEAWRACRRFLEFSSQEAEGLGGEVLDVRDRGTAGELLDDGADPRLTISEPRWLQGRLSAVLAKAPAALRSEIVSFIDGRLSELLASAADGALGPIRFIESIGVHVLEPSARRKLADALEQMIAAGHRADERGGESAHAVAARVQLLRLQLARSGSESEPSDGIGGGAAADLGAEWPVGSVAKHRGGRARSEEMGRGARVLPIPMSEESRSDVRGLRVGCDMQTQAIIATDGYGRRIGDPITIEHARNGGANFFFQPAAAEATAVGPVVVVRSGGVFVAFGAWPDGGPKPAKLWSFSEPADGPAEVAGIGLRRHAGGRLRRNGNVPLGMRVSEPDELGAAVARPAMLALANGVAICVDRSLQLRDPATGAILWQRHRLPVAGEVIGDEEFLCVCPRDGKGAVVVSTTDGGIARTCDLPRHELRLAACGRRLVVIDGAVSEVALQAGRPPRVKLELLDPATLERIPLGEYAADARATSVGREVLAVVEPTGTLTVLDLRRGTVRFRTTLTDMPPAIEQLQVLSWEDRFLVIVGRPETVEEQKQFEKLGVFAALPQMTPGEESIRLFTGSIWAVAAKTGEMLWPVPATVTRQALHQNQPGELPVLVFSRQIMLSRQADRFRVSMLCLDKRTGHAVHADDKIMAQPHMFAGCEISGDPATHSITLSRIGGESPDVRLEFTGEPMAPKPPFQASGKPPVTGDLLTELQYWLQRALAFPLRF